MWNLFYRNPRLLTLVLILILVAGSSAYVLLPRMEDPLLTPRFATINTRLPGATAERVEALVTERLENELREIAEIKEVRSTSRVGISTISVELRDDVYETAEVWSRVRDRLDDARAKLPETASEPDFDEVDVKAFALIIAISQKGDRDPNFTILGRLTKELEDRLKAVSGTEDVKLYGLPEEEFTVTIQPEQLAARGLTVHDLATQLTASDAKVSSGQVRGERSDLLLEMDTELDSHARIADTVIGVGPHGEATRLGDVASVAKSFRQPRRSLTVASGYPAVAIGVLARNDKRIDVWNADAMKVVNAFREEMPSDILVQELFVQDAYVTERLRSLQMNLLLGASAVVVVIGVLMGWRNALVVGLTLPLAAWMVLAGLQVLRIPLHQMSVTGLILALGLLIDNAIVVVDEVTVRMREGNSPADAVAASSRHLAVPLFGSTLTTALAFAPIALMPGPAGEFVGSIAISVILAIFSSFLLAMTVVPTVAAMVAGRAHDRNDPRETQEKTWSMLRDGFRSQALAENYRRVLVWLFSHPKTAITLSIILPFVGFLQARTLPLQFFPPADRDQLQIELEMPSHASLQETHRLADQVRQRLRRYPEIQEVHWFIGESAPMFYYNLVGRRKDTAHYAQALVQLTEVSSDTSLIHQLQRDLDRAFPGARLLVRQLEQGPPFDAPLELRLLGPDLERLEELASEIRSVLAQTPGVIHTRTESASTLPNVSVRVDETAARLAGLDHRVIAQQLESTLEGSLGGLVLETTEDLPVRIRLPNAARNDLAQIGSLDLLPNTAVGDGTFAGIPLAAVTSFQVVPERAAIERLDGVRMSEVQAFIPAGTLPAVVQRQFETRWNASGTRLPAGYTLKFAGEAAERNEAVGNLLGNVGLLAVMMVATLVLSFGSFRLSAIIGGVALLSVGLGLGSLWLYGSPFGFMAIVGTMGLIGVAINDAIVVLAALRENREAAMGDVSATVEVVLRATRHVVATSVTTLAGFTPLVLAGGGFWPPLAITIASGVSGATLLALVFVPAVHRLGVGAAPSGVWQRWTKRDTVTKIPTTATAVA